VSAAGGWLQGGGLSSTARKYGLGVDNVLRFDVVLADGRAVVADACSEPELFWALRGGGGGTFGVVTSVIYKLHERETIVTLDFHLNTWGAFWPEQRESFVKFWIQEAPTLDNRWGGYWSPYSLNLQFVGSRADADATFLDAFDDWQKENEGWLEWWVYDVDEERSYFDYRGGEDAMGNPEYTDATGSGYEGLNLASRLVPKSYAEERPDDLRRLLIDLVERSGIGGISYFLGGVTAEVGADETSVHPAQRTAIFNIMSTNDEAHDMVREALPNADGNGVCFNHHATLEPDWRNAAFGANYDRLLAAKDTYDPDRRFNCWHCVGYRGAEMEQGDEDSWTISRAPTISPAPTSSCPYTLTASGKCVACENDLCESHGEDCCAPYDEEKVCDSGVVVSKPERCWGGEGIYTCCEGPDADSVTWEDLDESGFSWEEHLEEPPDDYDGAPGHAVAAAAILGAAALFLAV